MTTAGPASQIRIVLVGKDAPKQTKLGNFIIQGHTKSQMSLCGEWRGRSVTVVKTPDSIFSLSEEKVREEMRGCVSLCPPGPNVLLLLVRPSDFIEKDRESLNIILSLFGPDALKHSMVVNTHSDKKKTSDTVKLLQDCGGRCYDMYKQDHKHDQLMQMIKEIVDENPESVLCTTDLVERFLKVKLDDSNQSREPLRVVLVGKTGSGKSAAGNTILGKKYFPSKSSQSQVTTCCSLASREIDGRRVVVTDTPGLFGTTLTNDEVKEQILSCVEVLTPGPYVILLVLQIGQFREEEKQTVELIKKIFGEQSQDFTIVLFTRGDFLRDQTIESHIEEGYVEFVRNLIQQCGERCHVFNNNDQANRTQVNELLTMVEEVVDGGEQRH